MIKVCGHGAGVRQRQRSKDAQQKLLNQAADFRSIICKHGHTVRALVSCFDGAASRMRKKMRSAACEFGTGWQQKGVRLCVQQKSAGEHTWGTACQSFLPCAGHTKSIKDREEDLQPSTNCQKIACSNGPACLMELGGAL
eukprot:1157583-Pelagomonas_calceolata.AAC.2